MSTKIIHQKPINNNVLDYLSEYLKAGFNVIPLQKHDKIPTGKWKPLLKKPLTKNELDAIYKKNPELNIGLITGVSFGGLVVIDIDHSPSEELTLLIAQNPTTTVKTGRGKHYYYRTNKELPNLKFDWGELRAQDIYIVAPPSIHPLGGQYQFLDGNGLDEIAQIPESIIEFLMSSKKLNNDSTVKVIIIDSSVARLNIKKDGCSKIELKTFNSCYTLEDTLKDFEIAKKVMWLCGREVGKLGESFNCPIHADQKPSVALWQGDNGKFMLHEFHIENRFRPLAEVYASVICKKDIKLKPGELITWWLRALEDIGYIQLPEISFKELPKDASVSVKKLYNGFIYLLRLRKIYDPKQTSAPFSWSFALKWCGIGSMATVKKSMKWLLANGYIKMVEKGCKIGEGAKAALFSLG